MLSEARGILRQRHEHSLRDVSSGMRFASHAKGSGVDQVNVSPDQFGEHGFGAAFGEVMQQLLISLVVHSPDNTRSRKDRTKKCRVRMWATLWPIPSPACGAVFRPAWRRCRR